MAYNEFDSALHAAVDEQGNGRSGHSELEVHYQPIVALDGAGHPGPVLYGVEALLHWRHPRAPDHPHRGLIRHLDSRTVPLDRTDKTRTGGASMSRVRRFDHIGITVANLDKVTAFFVGLGLELEGRMFMEGEFVDTVIGIPDSRSEIVMLRPPDGGAGLELARFTRPDHGPGSPAAMSNELGLRNVAFEVDDLQEAIDRLAADGYGLVGGVGQYENVWRMAYVRGPEGIIVSLAERIG